MIAGAAESALSVLQSTALADSAAQPPTLGKSGTANITFPTGVTLKDDTPTPTSRAS